MNTTVISGLIVSACAIPSWAEAAAAQQSPLASFMPLVLVIGIFYFLMIRPQQKRAKEHQAMLNALKKDDKILTAGGIYATVISVKGDIAEVRIADTVKVMIARSTISAVVAPEQAAVIPEIVK